MQQRLRASIPVVDLNEVRTCRSWDWVCASLVDCVIPILDTVFVQKQRLWSWYFNTASGVICRKHERKLTPELIQDVFARKAKAVSNDDCNLIAVCWFDEQHLLQYLDLQELATFLATLGACAGNIYISVFIPPKGGIDPLQYANLEHEYALTKAGTHQGKLFRRALGGQRIVSMETSLTALVGDLVNNFIRAIEKSRKCRVVRCVSCLVLDTNEQLHLWRTTAFETIPCGSNPAIFAASSAVYDGPHAVTERIVSRAKAEASRRPDEKMVEAILSAPTPQQRRPQLTNVIQYSRDTSETDRMLALSPLKTRKDLETAIKFLPASSKLSHGRRRALSAVHLASSQKRGCSGDYCHMSVKKLTARRLENKNADFVDAGANLTSVFTATAAANAFMRNHAADMQSASTPSHLLTPKPGSPQHQQRELHHLVSNDDALSHLIPFKYIAQTRAEKQLVNIFVRRYENGDDGEYLAEEFYGDGEPLGQTFPGYYYQQVKVCGNCFAFYTLVEEVRMKALDNIDQKRRKRGHPPIKVLSPIVDEKEAEETEGGEQIESSRNDLDRVSSLSWAHAGKLMNRISKADIAEMYSLVHPHPAVSMVLDALAIMLLGKEATAAKLKSSVGHERIVALMSRIALEHIDASIATKLASYTHNPLFKPGHISPINSCAGRICDWILATLQAYAWKYTDVINSSIRRSLCFLKPELLPADVHENYSSLINATDAHPIHAQAIDGTNMAHNSDQRSKEDTRRTKQAKTMARLAAPTGSSDPNDEPDCAGTFQSSDGITKMPYVVFGRKVDDMVTSNLLVFHDFFDTYANTQVFFNAIAHKCPGVRILVFNMPGQGHTTYPKDSTEAVVHLSNVWIAEKVDELFSFLLSSRQLCLQDVPANVVGFGNGANIATQWLLEYGAKYHDVIRSMVVVNGFASIDDTLLAFLNDAKEAFRTFPSNRPDLPVSFMAKYAFSDSYISRVGMNLALSIYTAIPNPITKDGRLRICRDTLQHADIRSKLDQIQVPLVLVHSTDNRIVDPQSMDVFVQGRGHIYKAESVVSASKVTLESDVKHHLLQVLGKPKSAFVSRLEAGHEVRQEMKTYLSQLCEVIITSTSRHPIPQKAPKTVRRCLKLVKKMPLVANDTQQVTQDEPIDPSDSNALAGHDLTTSDGGEDDIPVPDASDPTVLSAVEDITTDSMSVDDASPEDRQVALIEEDHESTPMTKLEDLEVQSAPKIEPPPKVKRGKSSVQEEKDANKALSDERLELKWPEPSQPLAYDPILDRLPTASSSQPPARSSFSTSQQKRSVQRQGSTGKVDKSINKIRDKIAKDSRRLEASAKEAELKQQAALEERKAALLREQEERRLKWEAEDRARLEKIEADLQEERLQKALSHKVASQVTPDVSVDISPFVKQKQEAEVVIESYEKKLPSLFDIIEEEERNIAREGLLHLKEYESVQDEMEINFHTGVEEHENFLRQELNKRRARHATCIQKHIRSFLATRYVHSVRRKYQQERIRRFAAGEMNRIARGYLGRRRYERCKVEILEERRRKAAAIILQKVVRGFMCRIRFRYKLRMKKAGFIQRAYRGYKGRCRCIQLRAEREERRRHDILLAKLQATWRMYVARSEYLTYRLENLAATEVQRTFRGLLGRRDYNRKKQWHEAEPGPERLALGLEMIEASKQAFERQQEEINELHRAQEMVESKVSAIHTELQESEGELAVLERELQEIDQMDSDLRELTHEAEMLRRGGYESMLRRNTGEGANPLGSGEPLRLEEDVNSNHLDVHAVEMALQIKRAERDRKKQELESEFTSVFAEVQQKRRELAGMEEKLADMEATRMRKDREFARLQRNLMELLEEQKMELDNLREKGIELETATATSAAAAAATAMKAKEHEERSHAMFSSTEELMKFQFMSMSLSYFSSLNMIKNLRDINADTTAAAISSTAETAAAAAAAASAANIPAVNQLPPNASEIMISKSDQKKQELRLKAEEEKEALQQSPAQPLPDAVRDWSLDDVGRWLDSLSLSQYKPSFREAAVDGEFLLELRAEDLADVLGISHKLHVRKVLLARNKLLPLSEQEKLQLDAVQHEQAATAIRIQSEGLDPETVFSQARNGRLKRLTESIEAGFDVNTEDDKGNTLLLIACQNVNMKIVEFLVMKRANINHKNAQGNTPLHFAMEYDSDGALGEYLIARGADDTIENIYGLTPYDGLNPP